MPQQKRTRPIIGSGWFMSCLGLTLAASANAVSFDTGHPDIRLDWDSTLKYTAGWRTAARDSRLANSPSRDEGEYSVDRGDMIMNRADVFTQIDLIYRQTSGIRISAAGWYDFDFDRNVKQNPALDALSSYEGNRFSSEVQRFYKGPSGEILDAFVFTTVDIGDTPLNLRLGQHTVYWGTSIYDHFSNGIAYGQAPVDARKSAMIPGTTAQELFLPVAQLSVQSQITDQLSLSGQYLFDWKPTRFSEGGTYFAGSDALFSAPDRRPSAADPLVTEPHLDNLEPGRKHGSFGLSLAWMPEFLGGELTAFYRQFDDPTPWLAPQSINGGYRLVYPEDIRLFGLSLNRDIAGNSLGVELSMRRNTPLNALGINNLDNQGPRGNTLHLIGNMVGALPNAPLYSTGTWTAELSYAHLMKVTRHKELYRGEGYGCDALGMDAGQGCSTDDFFGITAQVTPQWLQVLPGVNLSMPVTGRYGLHGNGATSANGQEGTYTVSLGLQADIYQRVTAALTFVTSYAPYDTVVDGVVISGRDGFATRDRDWLAFSVQTSF